MKLSNIAAIAMITSIAGTTAFAEMVVDSAAPFSISLGVAFNSQSIEMETIQSDLNTMPALQGMNVETLSASVATGGHTTVSNATAAIVNGHGATSSNGGATSSDALDLTSKVQTIENGFESSVGTTAIQVQYNNCYNNPFYCY
jgi:hypothetical protein